MLRVCTYLYLIWEGFEVLARFEMAEVLLITPNIAIERFSKHDDACQVDGFRHQRSLYDMALKAHNRSITILKTILVSCPTFGKIAGSFYRS
jgi:hypothetical protein